MALSHIPWYIDKLNNQFIDNLIFSTIQKMEKEHGNKVVWPIMFYVNYG
jgi:hypothetical protein